MYTDGYTGGKLCSQVDNHIVRQAVIQASKHTDTYRQSSVHEHHLALSYLVSVIKPTALSNTYLGRVSYFGRSHGAACGVDVHGPPPCPPIRTLIERHHVVYGQVVAVYKHLVKRCCGGCHVNHYFYWFRLFELKLRSH